MLGKDPTSNHCALKSKKNQHPCEEMLHCPGFKKSLKFPSEPGIVLHLNMSDMDNLRQKNKGKINGTHHEAVGIFVPILRKIIVF